MLYVHLIGLVKENKLIKMHGISNFKIRRFQFIICDQPSDILKTGGVIGWC
jgi:hypothetical protein